MLKGMTMHNITYNNKKYEIDDLGFLVNPDSWDEDFAEGMAIGVRIPHQLTKEHHFVINFIRGYYRHYHKCPNVFETCRGVGLGLTELRRLFPTGYLRGACKLAGITYKDIPVGNQAIEEQTLEARLTIGGDEYLVDYYGFLIDPGRWDEKFAEHTAAGSSIAGGGLTDEHWRGINFLRQRYAEYKTVPLVYETCDVLKISLKDLERLFPDGYHRGAVKIAGLRVR